MIKNHSNKYKLNNKITCKLDPHEDFPVLFGLCYRDIEDGGEYILSISYNTELLYQFRNKYLDQKEIENSWIGAVDLLLISKISLSKEIGLMLKCDTNIQNRFIINKVDFIKKKETHKLYCLELINNNLTEFSYTGQHLFVIDNKIIYGKNFTNLLEYFKGYMIKNEIILDKFYPESIKLNNYKDS